MNFNYLSDSKFIIKLNSNYLNLNNNDLYKTIKSILIKIKKRYLIDIIGFYDVKIYNLDNLITIVIFDKKDNDNYFSNIIDLKINKYKRNIKVKYDYFINKKYKNKYTVCEFYRCDSLNLHN